MSTIEVTDDWLKAQRLIRFPKQHLIDAYLEHHRLAILELKASLSGAPEASKAQIKSVIDRHEAWIAAGELLPSTEFPADAPIRPGSYVITAEMKWIDGKVYWDAHTYARWFVFPTADFPKDFVLKFQHGWAQFIPPTFEFPVGPPDEGTRRESLVGQMIGHEFRRGERGDAPYPMILQAF